MRDAPRYLRGTVVLGAQPDPAPRDRASSWPQWSALYEQAAGDFAAVEQTVKRAHARISPWLWIFSIWGAFGTTVAVWNKAEQLRDRGWRIW